jgi:leucyl-tRNA synthetase
MPDNNYVPSEIEPKWQSRWREKNLFIPSPYDGSQRRTVSTRPHVTNKLII